MKYFIYILFFFTLFLSCVDEDYFGYSNYGNIKEFVISNQASNAVIYTDSLLVTVEIPAGVDLVGLSIQKLKLSSFARADKEAGDILNLNEPQIINVTAEDGSIYKWTIKSCIASETPQLDNADMNQWYKTTSNYYEPGSDANSTIWGTGNPGSMILGKLATTPYDLGNGNLAANLETLDNGILGSIGGAPISAGSLFTGVFDKDKIDPSDPEAAIDFGTPFSGRPEKIRFKYTYAPGEVNKDKSGAVLDYSDACDIYALLEIRLGGKKERLATAWFRSSEIQDELRTIEVSFVYGPLDNTFPDYMFPVDYDFVSADSADYVLPTHISFVASSSYDGANFAGAIDSKLMIDDIEMIYNEE